MEKMEKKMNNVVKVLILSVITGGYLMFNISANAEQNIDADTFQDQAINQDLHTLNHEAGLNLSDEASDNWGIGLGRYGWGGWGSWGWGWGGGCNGWGLSCAWPYYAWYPWYWSDCCGGGCGGGGGCC